MAENRKNTIYNRVRDYEQEGMYIFDAKKKIMMCKHCNVRVCWEKKSTVDNHCSSEGHKTSKQTSEVIKSKRQSSITESVDHAKRLKTDKEDFIMSTLKTFLKANVPLHKLDHPALKKWLETYVKGK